MHASDLIAPDLPPLRPDDTVGRALDWMEEFKVRHLPVTENGRLVGLVRDTDLVDRNDAKAPVRELMGQAELPYVREGQHIYDVMKLMAERGLTVLPVLDPTGTYLGAINEHEALRRLAEAINIGEPGSVLVLEMNQNDYSLQRIAGIVESNGAKLLSVYNRTLPEGPRLEVTLKVNREDISDILQSFERFDYFVKSTYQGSKFHEDLRGRYDELMRFLDL
ncbi:MAG: CBS domain-containing protein [Flavobacteriales bacterium]|jgi:CBS domain-containing protein|nr:CBS domain-containing protein [Flavobacteriales bacterium]MBK7942647.1 CBS domain-containing protein [Flavobacteriales bacterium]MBK8950830.1 CBS domain-containing protein [Flavobacteriales bacterium]MBK9698949.1 CBS domain-containing protein [Flavobacteriales bacterium]